MGSYRFTPDAEQDLDAILDYGLDQFGVAQTSRYQGELGKCFQMLADNPQLGRHSPDLTGHVRRHEHGRHVIFYRATDAGVLILAIIDNRSTRLPNLR